MSKVSEIRIKQTLPCYTVSIRKTINFMEEYATFFGESISRIDNFLVAHGALTGSHVMSCFHNMDLAHLDVEVGYHLAQELPSEGDVSCRNRPSCKAVTAMAFLAKSSKSTSSKKL